MRGCPVGTVRSRLNRGRKQLQQDLQHYMPDPTPALRLVVEAPNRKVAGRNPTGVRGLGIRVVMTFTDRQCEETREGLSAMIDGAVSPAEEAALRRHLDDCFHCAAYERKPAGVGSADGRPPDRTVRRGQNLDPCVGENQHLLR